MKPIPPTRWISVSEAHKITGIPRTTIRYWCRTGKIASSRRGGTKHYIDLYALLKSYNADQSDFATEILVQKAIR